jgi:hypothetical protein
MEPMTIVDYVTSIVPGLYLADFISGLIHLFFDTRTITGHSKLDALCEAFHLHHQVPVEFLTMRSIELLHHGSVPIVPLLFSVFNYIHATPKKHILTQITTLYGLHVIQFVHHKTHYINHATPIEKDSLYGRFLIFLQENHIILSPKEHRRHHTEPYDTTFCLVNGWANPLLNAIVGIPCIHSKLFD